MFVPSWTPVIFTDVSFSLYLTEWVPFSTSQFLLDTRLVRSLRLSIKIYSDIVLCFSSRNYTRSSVWFLFFYNCNFFTLTLALYFFQFFLKILLDIIKCIHNSIKMFLKLKDLIITAFLILHNFLRCLHNLLIHLFHNFLFFFRGYSFSVVFPVFCFGTLWTN